MQRCITDSYAADKYRIEPGYRRHRTCSTDLELDSLDLSEFFLCRKLVRNRPPRCTGYKPKLALQRETIDLVHHAIDVVAKCVTLATNGCVIGKTSVYPLNDS